MKITVKHGDQSIYEQSFDDAKHLQPAVSLLMQQASGDRVVTTISNNGNDLVFKHAALDHTKLIRLVNPATRIKAA